MHTIKDVLKKKFSCWQDFENLVKALPEETERGNAFEYFCFYYFKYFSDVYQIRHLYSDKIKGHEIPLNIKKHLRLEKTDWGVDGVFVRENGKITAYQAKFRSSRTPPSNSELSKFWSEAENADERLIIANSYSLPITAGKKQRHLEILCDKLDRLPSVFFKDFIEFFVKGKSPVRQPKSPKPFQVHMLKNIYQGFLKSNRGKLIAACGTGKTLIALWDSERVRTGNILFLAPSLMLVRQTLEQWVMNRRHDFSYLCICSDRTITSGVDDDFVDLSPSALDIPVTTNPEEIISFFRDSSKKRRVAFCTYHSQPVLIDALKKFSVCFESAYFDEAHRTAGVKQSEIFALGLKDSLIPAKRRLFLTATERLIKPWIRERIKEKVGEVVFSMDDVTSYGPIFHKLTFGQAIQKNLICDYEIIVAGVSETPTFNSIEKNRYISLLDDNGIPITNNPSAAQEAAKAALLASVFEGRKAHKIISYHSNIETAKHFTNLLSITEFFSTKRDYAIKHINSRHNAHDRALIISTFQHSDYGVLTNVRCLTEGVDLPFIDGVMFCDPKGSLIDIVQAIGRALRKPYDVPSKKAIIIVPVFLPENTNTFESIPTQNFEALHNVIQALRDVDETLAEWIDEANFARVKGTARFPKKGLNKLSFVLPEKIKIRNFEDSIYFQIADFNKNPFIPTRSAVVLGKNERSSSFDRFFRTLGDYNINKYEESLVRPTVDLFQGRKEVSRSFLKIDNNNVSHTERLGIIVSVEKDTFRLTELGRFFASKKFSFPSIFANQALLFKDTIQGSSIYPYRAALEILREVKTLNRYEFQYGPYLIEPFQDINKEVLLAIERIHLLRKEYPNLSLISDSNRRKAKSFLDSLHRKRFKDADIWTDRTTVANQYRFFINHLSILCGTVVVPSQTVSAQISITSVKQINRVLNVSTPPNKRFSEYYGYFYWLDKI